MLMGNWPARHDLNCWLDRKTSTQTKNLSCSMTKTNNMACAPSEDSDQPGHLIRLGGCPGLIWVFAWRTGHFVGSVMFRLILLSDNTRSENCWCSRKEPKRGWNLRTKSSDYRTRLSLKDLETHGVTFKYCFWATTWENLTKALCR